MCAAVEFRILDGIADFAIPQATKRQRIGNEIEAAMVFARSDFVNRHRMPWHSGAVGWDKGDYNCGNKTLDVILAGGKRGERPRSKRSV